MRTATYNLKQQSKKSGRELHLILTTAALLITNASILDSFLAFSDKILSHFKSTPKYQSLNVWHVAKLSFLDCWQPPLRSPYAQYIIEIGGHHELTNSGIRFEILLFPVTHKNPFLSLFLVLMRFQSAFFFCAKFVHKKKFVVYSLFLGEVLPNSS